ncbi:MAG TPA: hypothetical protein VH331_08770 [Allosphingosinicella sp.]|jgi:hypothetical protein|nr:hypothetical protein [Allosphingosinicella sp.]
MDVPETKLPARLLERATLRGNEWAWPIGDIPEVIEAARQADLISIGGQLQLRLPAGATCECYWVEVDTFQSVPPGLPWSERVEKTATAAQSQFQDLQQRYNFRAEGRSAFPEQFEELEASGVDPASALCFVWYVEERDTVERV